MKKKSSKAKSPYEIRHSGNWIQGAVRKPGRVRDYMFKKYGNKAFNKDGTLKLQYLEKEYKTTNDESLKRAMVLAIRFHKGKV